MKIMLANRIGIIFNLIDVKCRNDQSIESRVQSLVYIAFSYFIDELIYLSVFYNSNVQLLL